MSNKLANADPSARLCVFGSYDEQKNDVCVRAVDTTETPSAASAASSSSKAAVPAAERLLGVSARAAHEGEVTDIRFVSESMFATASSNGSVALYALNDKQHSGFVILLFICNCFTLSHAPISFFTFHIKNRQWDGSEG